MPLSFLRRIFEIEPHTKRDPYAAAAQFLCKMVPACPICLSSLVDHSYATLAEAGNREDLERLGSAFDSKQWNLLSQIHSFDGLKNAICVYAVTCPAGAGFAVEYISYEEFWSDDQLVKSQALDTSEWSALLQTFPSLDWHAISHAQGPKARNIPA